jgi:tellurium resistance protein TerD
MAHEVIRLEPGANCSLTAAHPLLRELTVGFNWSIIKGNGPATEVVASAILVGENGKAVSDEHFVFFNQIESPDGSVALIANDDQEQLDVRLSDVPEAVQKIVFVAYADPDLRRPGNFAAVRNAYIHVDDREGNPIARFDLPQADSSITAVIFGELYRYKGEWKFRAGGQGYAGGIPAVARDYGVNL